MGTTLQMRKARQKPVAGKRSVKSYRLSQGQLIEIPTKPGALAKLDKEFSERFSKTGQDLKFHAMRDRLVKQSKLK